MTRGLPLGMQLQLALWRNRRKRPKPELRAAAIGLTTELRLEQALRGTRVSHTWDLARERDFRAHLPDPSPTSVSVIMPVRDRERVVSAAVESVLAQSWPTWELIVVDDGSTDLTPDVLARFTAKDVRIRVITTGSAGVSAARNTGIRAATGDFVAFLDSDNTWSVDFLATAIRGLQLHDSSFGYAGTQEHRADGVRYRGYRGGLANLPLGNFIDLNAVLVRRELLDRVGGFDVTLRRMVDYDLVWRLSELCDPAFLPFIGVIYQAGTELTDRISVVEPLAWDAVVKVRRSRDWASVRVAPRHADLVSVVIPVTPGSNGAVDTVAALRAMAELWTVEVIVVDSGLAPAAAFDLHLGLASSAAKVVRVPTNLGAAGAFDVGLADTVGHSVLLLPPGARPGPGLVAALTDMGQHTLAGREVLAAPAAALLRGTGLDPLLSLEAAVHAFATSVGARPLPAGALA